ncbi:MAG TPA: helix-turn-helix transcriptional regulator [Spirochaetota bacterium]|nr:helix-turn-helix transcriptional regulator [Spirochaetota bacterium]
MGDLRKYIDKRKKSDPEFAFNYNEGLKNFKIGLILRQAREESGLTQEELANKIKTTKSAISRIENHSDDIKLSTLTKVAKASGKNLSIRLL